MGPAHRTRDGVDNLFVDPQGGDFRVVAGSILDTDARFAGIDPTVVGLLGDGPVDPDADPADYQPLPPVLPALGDAPSGNPLGDGAPSLPPEPDTDPGAADGARALGIGLYEVSYYSGVEYFNDITSAMGEWLSFPRSNPGVFSDERPVALNETGFPLLAGDQGARSFVLAGETIDGTETYTPGTYTLTWEGQADLEVQVNWRTFQVRRQHRPDRREPRDDRDPRRRGRA